MCCVFNLCYLNIHNRLCVKGLLLCVCIDRTHKLHAKYVLLRMREKNFKSIFLITAINWFLLTMINNCKLGFQVVAL